MKNKITFIIPTIGRDTLSRTIDSLLNQTVDDWKAIIVFDGIETIDFKDKRITSLKIEKTGFGNSAGAVRNIGIDKADTEWIGFVDDDDTLSRKYVKKFQEELLHNPKADCFIFRMLDKSGLILPEPNRKNFVQDRVGISFAVRKKVNFKFEPSSREDYFYLDKLRNNKKNIIISPYVTYFVRCLPNSQVESFEFQRVTI